jgi:hypothetical protein
MASKPQREAGSPDEGAARALDGIYAAPFDAFVPRRGEAVAALRAAGHVAAARVVAAAAKPSRTAWALNQVARRRPQLLTAALEARAHAAAAQATGEGDALRATARAYRDALAALVQAATDAVRDDGGELTPAQGRRVSATVQAVAGAADSGLREAVLAGRLVADVVVDDPFAGLEAGPPRERPDGPAPPPRDELAARRTAAAERAREHDHARERERERRAKELSRVRARVAALEEEARAARVAAREAEIVASRAQVEAERLRRAVEAADRRLSDAKGELRDRSK